MAGANVPGNLKQDFIAAGQAYNIPPEVLAGVADVETGIGSNRGPSTAGAIGLMQFLPTTAASLGINPLNDRQAIFGTAKYLNQLGYQKNARLALGKYNGGPGNPQLGYADQVLAQAKRLAPQLGGKAQDVAAPSSGSGGSGGFWDSIVKGTVYVAFLGGGAFLGYLGLRQLMAPVTGGATA
jgi:soluble lytic murein transglycosylase-like protein